MILKKRNRLSLILACIFVIAGTLGCSIKNTAEAGHLGRRIIREEISRRHHSGHTLSLDEKRKVHKRIKEHRRNIIGRTQKKSLWD